MENLLTKRNLIIVGVVVIVALGVLIYLGTKSEKAPGEEGGGFFETLFPFGGGPATTPGAGAPTPAEQGVGASDLPLSLESAQSLPIGTLIKLNAESVSSLVPVGTTSVRYHKNVAESLGHLFERKANGTDEEKRISNFTVPQVRRVVWAPDARRAVVFYNLGSEIRKILIDYAAATPRTNFLPDSVSDVAFSPDSRRMAFINNLEDSHNIFIATSDFRNQRVVLNNDIPNFEISWPAQNLIALKTKSSYAARGFLYSLNPNTGEFTKVAEGLGLDAVWNSDGSGALYSWVTSDGNLFDLRFVDVKTGETKDLGIRTIAEKCVFLKTLKNVAYCGVPKEAPTLRSERASLPDAWWQGKISLSDDFFLVDAQNGRVSNFVQSPLDVIMPMVLADDSFLFFKDKTTNNLWGLKLKQ